MGVVLVGRGDRVIFEKAYGMADLARKRPNLIQTPFQIASVSKSFTAAALLRLVDQGRVDLQAPLSRYLPNYPGGEKIKIIHLLTHLSGIPNINTLEQYEALEKSAQTPESLMRVFAHLPLQFQPGQDRRYSNSNYVLLAGIIEKLSGLGYGPYLKKYIFEPLEMRRSGHPEPAGHLQKEGALGYQGEGAAGLVRARSLNWTVKTGNGSLYSTTGDLFLWARGLRSGKILSADALDAMFTDHGHHDGLGWFIRERLGRKAWYINGRSPGYSAYVGIFPEDELTVVVLANTYVPIATELGLDLAAKALDYPRPPSRLQSQPLAPEDVAPLFGCLSIRRTILQTEPGPHHRFSRWIPDIGLGHPDWPRCEKRSFHSAPLLVGNKFH